MAYISRPSTVDNNYKSSFFKNNVFYTLLFLLAFKFSLRNIFGSAIDPLIVLFTLYFILLGGYSNLVNLLISSAFLFSFSFFSNGGSALLYSIGGFSSIFISAFVVATFLRTKTHHDTQLPKIINILALVNSMSIFIFIFIDRQIFGLIGETLYTDDLIIINNGNLELRSYSVFGSSQLNGFLQFVFLYNALFFLDQKKFFYFASITFIFTAGILTGTRSFIILVVLFLVLAACSKPRRLFYVSFFIMIMLTARYLDLLQNIPIISRLELLFETLLSGKQSAQMRAWSHVYSYERDFLSYILGEGLGILSRAGQTIGGERYSFTTAESTLLQIWFEVGFFGLFIYFFWIFIHFRIRRSGSFAFLVCIVFSAATTPVLYASFAFTLAHIMLAHSTFKR